MNNLFLNWRFGTRQLQVCLRPGERRITFRVNPYHVSHPPTCWFERY